MAAHKSSINLLIQDDFSASAIGKIMLWALSIGRYIVVFTELVVILSFLSRFKLDRDLTDLNEGIARQKAIVLSYGNLEEKVIQTQNELTVVRDLTSGPSAISFLDLLAKIIPGDVKVDEVGVDKGAVSLVGTALSPQSMKGFINQLAASSMISNLEIGNLAAVDQGLTITFELKAFLEEKQ